ncbi:type VI secretion system tip protein VgrG [Pseudomonas putida]|uniref:type VI secretion system Vgr family protein n=1 Tax=Pseudomonas putida TaxID=303 RepID=UPI0023636160|nr:type VI secretion system Vgr family protein [Pseudomonas putida]MDD1965958.1 type VI secretion system tip protein VgrG [Pseudomonas putida]
MTTLTPRINSATRLYELEGPAPFDQMLVERWTGFEQLSNLFRWDLLTLSPEHDIAFDKMLGQTLRLLTTLADGSRCSRSGLVVSVRNQNSDGALTRYYLELRPWLWVLAQGRNSRVFQDLSVLQIVEQVFAGYPAYAHWQITGDAEHLLTRVRPRSYCTQYRESDLDFVERLLAEEGLGYCFVEHAQAPAGHSLIIFGDSTLLQEDSTSASATGLRFHRAASAEEQDSVQMMGPTVRSGSTRTTLLSSNYKTRQATTASLSLSTDEGRESYDPVGSYAFLTSAEASHYAVLHKDAHNVDRRFWKGQGTVRSARCGTRFEVIQAPWLNQGPYARQSEFLYTGILGCGVNNLPATVPVPEDRCPDLLGLDRFARHVLVRAQDLGYAQQFSAVPRLTRWRPTLANGTGQRLNPVPTSHGAQTAIVVGPDGSTTPGSGVPLYCDARGRVRLRFHWQAEEDRGACWVRVAQVLTGNGHGAQFLPRIGQEVLVQFMDGDMDRPVIVKSLYNGRGDAGVPPTPGGQPGKSDLSAYGQARDHRPSAELNRRGGNSPAWHGGGPGEDQHRNQAALSGIKTRGFDGQGYNQLVLDDSDQQGRLQMATTQAHSQLNLGHLIHQAGNYRGSFRGLGFELRTDAYGAIRARQGLLLSTYGIDPQTPAGDAVAAQALLEQQQALARRFDLAAQIHQTVPLSSVRGVNLPDHSALIADQAPLKALFTSLSTTVASDTLSNGLADAPLRDSHPAEGRVPQTGDALLTLSARDSLLQIAGQSLHHHAGETMTLGSGQDSNFAIGEQLRLHSGQAIGYLGGAQQADDIGLSLISGAGPLDVQAQHDDIKVLAQGELKLMSLNAETELAAGKAISIKVDGGASLTIEGGNITFACPGTMTLHAAEHLFEPGIAVPYEVPQFPEGICVECMLKAMNGGSALSSKNA